MRAGGHKAQKGRTEKTAFICQCGLFHGRYHFFTLQSSGWRNAGSCAHRSTPTGLCFCGTGLGFPINYTIDEGMFGEFLWQGPKCSCFLRRGREPDANRFLLLQGGNPFSSIIFLETTRQDVPKKQTHKFNKSVMMDHKNPYKSVIVC